MGYGVLLGLFWGYGMVASSSTFAPFVPFSFGMGGFALWCGLSGAVLGMDVRDALDLLRRLVLAAAVAVISYVLLSASGAWIMGGGPLVEALVLWGLRMSIPLTAYALALGFSGAILGYLLLGR